MRPATVATQQRSAWQSPVPYLFGGLAAMLGLIAFALLILACSYLKLYQNGDRDRDVESGSSELKDQEEGDAAKAVKVYEETILVIMAGDQKPTFLASPAVCTNYNASSFAADDAKETNQNEEAADPIET